MSKNQKLRDKFWTDPVPKDFSWAELQSMMKQYGYKERQGRGSRIKFEDANGGNKPRIHLHKRHPDPTLLEYQIVDVREGLNRAGIFK